MKSLLIVDDEDVHRLVGQALPHEDWSIATVTSARDALTGLQRSVPDIALLGLRLADGSGLEVLRSLRLLDPRVPIVLTSSGDDSGDSVIEGIHLGALDYIRKPIDSRELREALERASAVHDSLRGPLHPLADPGSDESPALIGHSPAMQRVYKAIGRVSGQNLAVLIRGESGTGKELIARALHQHSARRNATFLAINCAAIPESLLESELFGHEKGAFTGADRRHIGKFEQCAGGTLFLDEIGDMHLRLQAKLLRVLQDGTFFRVGSSREQTADVRIIAATHRDLSQMIEREEFRADLFYRLNGFTIDLPPLRQRSADLDLLVDHFRKRINRELGRSIQAISPEALAVLRRYTWPGNIRELQSVLRQAALETLQPTLDAACLPASLLEGGHRGEAMSAAEPVQASPGFAGLIEQWIASGRSSVYRDALEFMECQVLSLVLMRTQGRLGRAARILGLSRTTLRSKIQQYGILVDRIVRHDAHAPVITADDDE